MGVHIGEQATAKRADSAQVAGGTGNDAVAAARRRAWFTEAWKPTLREDAYKVSRIEGEVPREIHGTLYRNGPSQRILPKAGYQALHLFDGDGLVHGFRIEAGSVHYRGRFVENDCARFEQSEGVYCLDGFQTRADAKTDKFLYRVQPNTNVVFHGNKLMALVENAFPFEMDARTLASIGENDFGGKRIGMSVSAHPKIDGRTGQMVIHGYQPFEPYVQLYVVEPDGTCSLAENVDAPFPGMMHDLAITENYVVFILPPAVIDGAALVSGEKPFQNAMTWEPERGLLFGIRRRESGSPVRWLRAPSVGFVFHPGNAYEKDGKIVFDACTYRDGERLLMKTLPSWRSGRAFDEGSWQARPFLYEIDIDTGTVKERQLDDRGAEFPRLDDRLVGYENRFGYAVRMPKDAGGSDQPWNVIAKYDRRGGPSVAHDFGEGQFPGEPVFVPRSADAAEDDGFVLTTVYDGPGASTYLAILDARDMAGAPLAKCHLEHSIPMGFHGNFAPGVV
jgi:carotenoid cleavage dioxygenase